MRHSLLSRFQGGLLGSEIATIAASASTGKGESGIQARLLALLLKSGYLDEAEWRKIHQKRRDGGAWNHKLDNGELAVLALPLAFFFHDSPRRLEAQLRLFLSAGELTQDSLPELLLWGRIISLALREKLQPSYLIPQLLTSPTPLQPQLELVQHCLERAMPLAQAIAYFHQAPPRQQAIAAALYCFASTPEDFRLSTLQAARIEREVSGVAALTGALAGAYNSVSGIPVPWLLAVKKHPALEEIPQQAEALFAAWSGNYCHKRGDSLAKLAVAAAGTIQPRRSWQMISQREFP